MGNINVNIVDRIFIFLTVLDSQLFFFFLTRGQSQDDDHDPHEGGDVLDKLPHLVIGQGGELAGVVLAQETNDVILF